jgi:hypothetical protein
MSQTAVEWLLKYLIERDLIKKDDYIKIFFVNSSFEQALEMEKQQIIDAVEWDYKSNMGEVYYNATYKKKN